MNTIYFLLLLAGAICLFLATCNVVVQRVSLLALGLLCWILVPLIQAAKLVLH